MSDRTLMDSRYMDDATPITNALQKLAAVRAVEFKSLNGYDSRMRYGVEGQSMVDKLPLAVEKDVMGFHYVELDQLIPVIIAAINELASKTGSSATTRKTTASAR